MMQFDRLPFAQLTLIGAACVLLAGCPSNGSSAPAGTSAATSTSAPSSSGTSTVTSKTPSGGSPGSPTTSSGSGSGTSSGSGGTTTPPSGGSGSTTPPPPPPTTTPPPTKSVTLSWVAPTLNTDGTILNDLAGYTITYGTIATSLNQSVTVTGATSTTYTIANLAPGTYYFSVTAYSSAGTQSAPTPIISTTI